MQLLLLGYWMLWDHSFAWPDWAVSMLQAHVQYGHLHDPHHGL